MEEFNYAKYFNDHNIFDITSKDELYKMKRALEDCKKIEKYFFTVLPNINAIKNIIAFSFKLNRTLRYRNRIEYIRGIIYSQDYIDFNDVIKFSNLVTDYGYVVDLPTIFNEKCDTEYADIDFFEDLMIIDNLNGKSAYDALSYMEFEDENEEDDEPEDEDDKQIDGIVTMLKNINNSIGEKEEVKRDVPFDKRMIQITPEKKIENFKKNFRKYINIVFESKEINKEQDKREYTYVVLGMKDWFKFVIDIIETIYNISKEEKRTLRKKLSDFV